jgi:hypothetical protein
MGTCVGCDTLQPVWFPGAGWCCTECQRWNLSPASFVGTTRAPLVEEWSLVVGDSVLRWSLVAGSRQGALADSIRTKCYLLKAPPFSLV